jgi:hypothetical protein
MSTYQSPRREQRIALNATIDFDAILRLPGCEDLSPELRQAVLDEAGKLATNVLAPLDRRGDVKAGAWAARLPGAPGQCRGLPAIDRDGCGRWQLAHGFGRAQDPGAGATACGPYRVLPCPDRYPYRGTLRAGALWQRESPGRLLRRSLNTTHRFCFIEREDSHAGT